MSREFKIILFFICVVVILCLATVIVLNKVCQQSDEDFLIGARLSSDAKIIRIFGNPYICSLK